MESLLGNSKLSNLLYIMSLTKMAPGSMAEVGVYRGGTAKSMQLAMPEKELHLYDTFEGIVKADSSVDIHGNGEFSDVDLEGIKREMGKGAIFHVGMFPDTFTEHDTMFSFVHSDTDTYYGTQETLKVFADRMSVGGKILFDDWKWRGCPGVEKAIKEYLQTHNNTFVEYPLQFVINF